MTSPLTKKQWEASVAEMWSASVKATCQDLIDEAVKAERERLTDAAMKAAEKAVDLAIALEREACAKIADEWAVGWPHPSQVIAERIRERT